MVVNRATSFASVTWYSRRNSWPTVPFASTSEYSPVASQCHTSTMASASGEHAPEAARDTLRVRASRAPSLTTPVEGSLRMSDRLRFSST